MNGHDIRILVTINAYYIRPLCVMLRFLLASNSGESFDIYLRVY
jgi:hypothetical protein